MDEKSFPGLWPKAEPRLRGEPFDTLAEFDRALDERAIAVSEETANRSLGILCLTTNRDDESMWSYYGVEHRGACIEFDPMHAFFADKVRPVEYSADPIVVTIKRWLGAPRRTNAFQKRSTRWPAVPPWQTQQ